MTFPQSICFDQVCKNPGPAFESPIWIGSPDQADLYGKSGLERVLAYRGI